MDGQRDRRTDGRTPDSCIDPAPHTMRGEGVVAVKCTAESTGLKMHSVMFATKQAQSKSLTTTTMMIDEAIRKK